MSRFIVTTLLLLTIFGFGQSVVAIDYVHDMPYTAPNYPGLGTNPYEKITAELGEPQSGIYYSAVYATYGPTTADGETSGICDGTTIGSAQTQKYGLACSLLHALFSLDANWQSQTVNLETQTFQTCCEGAGCTVPKKYIHTTWSYTQRGKVTKARVKVNAQGELDRNGQWCNWKFCSPCDAGYCTLYTRAAYSSSSTNLANTHDPELRSGVPSGSPCNP